ncbi:heavy metal translocating P-type ATPase [Campylobacter blaseri]|uniref:P-type Zn(2+) transporter n=1 Tax=Campylobacter blaseri TaxID=2042961 RepID=A0A2P8QYZ5_9BACT|nr:cation-translocating P-type ATPase [Campylobacter blaseri]PSM51468.1 heavy metal translocating P-type ATPase [Campylobacter blaseri]PSM52917.1 heavy metal translocating P-type ATPase [Campylobacter blaseri]QKF86526.1 heavy metal translocating P-type ATPase [Campylobacter blaseri]
MSKTIEIKSNIKNRARLKSKIFTKSNELVIENILSKEVKSIRMNFACHSLIVEFDSNITNLNRILERLNSIFDINKVVSKNIVKNKIKENYLTSCNSCKSCTLYPNEKSWKRKLFEYGALSVVAIGVFIKEHILMTALSPVAAIALGGLSVFAALPLINDAYNDILNKKFTLETFMAAAVLTAIFGGEISAAFEVIYILRGSRLFEEYTAEKSRLEIKNLIKMDVKKVYVQRGDVEIQINLEDVSYDDIVIFVHGEKICVDGTIIEGEAEINESIINGYSQSVHKKVGDKVFANTIVDSGRIKIKVDALGDETYIARVLGEVDKYLSLKSSSEVMADKLAKRVLKVGTLLTISTLFLTSSFTNAFSVMIMMSCPCATVLAASSAISSAITNAAKHGILIKGGIHLENISKADVFCFDKTGTLTTAKPIVVDYKSNLPNKEFFEILLSLEDKNSHPIAKAIVDYGNELGFKKLNNIKIDNKIGLGVQGKIGNDTYHLGNLKLMQDNKITIRQNKALKEQQNRANTIIYLAKNYKFAGFISLSHEIRDGSYQMIEDLRKRGVKKIILLTGDDELVAKEFAKKFNFDEVHHNLMPDEKAKIVETLSKDHNVAMIGDGVNDTLAMSKADTSISFASGGSEAAIEVSNIAITNSDPKDIIKLYDLSKFALKIANQNYLIGTSTNIIGSGAAMLGLIGPAGAGLTHIGHTSAIILNSSRNRLKQ